MPRYVGLKSLAVLVLATAITGVFAGGHGGTVVAAVTSWSGLAIEEVRITGQSETSEVDVLERLAINTLPSIVTFDVEAARARVETLPWIKQATLRKLYPKTLEVAITERQPFAIWQRNGKIALIDENGEVIADEVGERYTRLPFVSGAGAGPRVKEFLALIEPVPGIAARVRAGVLVSERRWNVVLSNGVEIFLPEERPAAALQHIAGIDAGSGLLGRDIAVVDLRFAERIIVRLSESGDAARKAMLKEREKLAKKARTNT